MQHSTSLERKNEPSVEAGDLVRYWDEWTEYWHVGIVVEKTAEATKHASSRFNVFFSGTIPGYLQSDPSYKRMLVFSCYEVALSRC